MFLPEVKSKVNEDISILIKLDNYSFNFICECGDASDLTVKECQNTEAIFISHTHIDHFINFDFVLRHQIGIGRRIIICGPEGITQQVQSKIKGYQWNLIEENSITYEIREIKRDGQVEISEINPPHWEIIKLENKNPDTLYKNKRFTVDFVILDHKTDSIAYLFKEEDTVKIDLSKSEFKGGKWVSELKTAFEKGDETALIKIDHQEFKVAELFHLLEIKQGDSLGVIMDHAANEANHKKIQSLFQNCNQAFIECFYKAEDKEFAKLNFHSYSEESAKIMKTCNVKTATPVHFSRKYKEEEVKVLLDEFYTHLK
ncbi:MAG: peptidase [Saprospiraceae bacterium]